MKAANEISVYVRACVCVCVCVHILYLPAQRTINASLNASSSLLVPCDLLLICAWVFSAAYVCVCVCMCWIQCFQTQP